MDFGKITNRLLEFGPDLVVVLDSELCIKYHNRAFSDALQASDNPATPETQALKGTQEFLGLIHSDDVILTTGKLKDALKEKSSFSELQIRNLSREENYVWIEWSGFFDRKSSSLILIGRDITSRKELDLRERSFMRDTQKIGRIGGWRMTLPSQEIDWSDELFRLLQLPQQQDLTLQDFIDHCVQDSRTKVAECMQKLIDKGIDFDEEIEMCTGMQRTVWVRLIGRVDRRDTRVQSIQGIIQDITTLMQLRRAEESAQRQLLHVTRNFPGVLFQVFRDEAGRYSFPFVSEKIFSQTGITVAEIVTDADTFLGAIPQSDRSQLFKKLEESQSNNSQIEWEGRITGRDGEEIWAMIRCQPESTNSRVIKSWGGVLINVTDKKRMEIELEQQRMATVQTAKMASLGEMAGGVAHEINNPLAIINGMAVQLREQVMAGSAMDFKKAERYINKIETTANRIADVVRSLRSFAVGSDSDSFVRVELRSLIESALNLTKDKLRFHSIDVRLDVDKAIELDCRKGQLIQVFVNMISNSFHALQDIDLRWVAITAQVKNEIVRIEIKDSGPGIPLEIRDRILEPFFTTKDVGAASGLGLSISQGIIQSHGGKLFLNSNAKNTQFTIELPLSQPRQNITDLAS